MPQVFRAMLKEDNAPKVGDQRDMLGVRVPTDIEPDENDIVSPGNGGLSVNPDWKKLPAHLIPKKYNGIVADARGKRDIAIWRYGEVPFESANLNDKLQLRIDKPSHGSIEPRAAVGINEFQKNLADTLQEWKEVEL
jgi:hypothetical protein